MSKDTLYCSFCGKPQHEVLKLIAGPTVFICNECVQLCVDIIQEETQAQGPDAAKFARARAREEAVETMIMVVVQLLKDEERLHKPYVVLEDAMKQFQINQEPLPKTGAESAVDIRKPNT